MAVYRMKDLDLGKVEPSMDIQSASEKLEVQKDSFILAFYLCSLNRANTAFK